MSESIGVSRSWRPTGREKPGETDSLRVQIREEWRQGPLQSRRQWLLLQWSSWQIRPSRLPAKKVRNGSGSRKWRVRGVRKLRLALYAAKVFSPVSGALIENSIPLVLEI